MIGFIIGYVMGTKAGEDGLAELKSTVRQITSSEELRELAGGVLSLVTDVVKSSAKTLSERSELQSPGVRRIA